MACTKDVCRGSWQAWRQPWSSSGQEKPSSLPWTGLGESEPNFVQSENNLFASGEDKARERRENWQEGKIVLEWAPVFLQKNISILFEGKVLGFQNCNIVTESADVQPLIENWFTIFFCANQPLSRRFLWHANSGCLHFRKETRTWFWNRWLS